MRDDGGADPGPGTGGRANLRQRPGTFSLQSYPGAVFGCPVFTGLEGEENLQLMDTFSFYAGAHQVRVGGQAHQVRTFYVQPDPRFSTIATLKNAGTSRDDDTDNFTGYVGGLESPLFGQPTAAFEKRRQQLGVRIDF